MPYPDGESSDLTVQVVPPEVGRARDHLDGLYNLRSVNIHATVALIDLILRARDRCRFECVIEGTVGMDSLVSSSKRTDVCLAVLLPTSNAYSTTIPPASASITFVSRIIETFPPVLAWNASDATAKHWLDTNSWRVACHTATAAIWVVDADIILGAILGSDALATAVFVALCGRRFRDRRFRP
jgi:hypothetical protein